MKRRPLIIVASVIVLLGIIAGLYFAFSGSADLIVSDDPFAGIGSGLGEGPEEMSQGAGTEVAPRLIRVTTSPVAEGAVAINLISTTTTPVTNASGTPALAETVVTDTEVRFIDRASGNMYRFRAHERSLARLSNKTLPGIQQASWLPDGTVAYVRFLTGAEADGRVATYVLPESGEGGFFLEQGLAGVKTTGSSTLFTLLSGATGSVGSISRSDGTNARTLFTSLLSSITVHPSQGSFFGHTKPSALLEGYAFQIHSTTGAFTRILGPLRGLSTLPSPNGDMLLFSYLDRGTLRLAVLDTVTRNSTALPVATLAEKCTWAPSGRSAYCAVPKSLPQLLPDNWYQGAATLSDRLWEIDMTDRLALLVVDPSAVADVSVDAVALHTDPAEDVLVFTDKHNGSLWVYDL